MDPLVSLQQKLELPTTTESSEQKLVIDYLNDLIIHDFPRLVQLLYRFDIDEAQLKQTIAVSNDRTAAELIFQLLLEREKQRLHSKNLFKREEEIPDDEKW